MKTYCFQVELEIAEEQDMQSALSQVMQAIASSMGRFHKPDSGPPMRLTVIDLGLKK